MIRKVLTTVFFTVMGVMIAFCVIVTGAAIALNSTPASPRPVSNIPDELMSQYYCALPCWYGITPGKSDLQQTLSIMGRITELQGWNPEDIAGLPASRDNYTYLRWKAAPGLTENRVVLIDGIVARVDRTVLAPFTIKNFLAKYGNADAIRIIFYNRSFSGLEDEGVLEMYYPSLGLIAYFKFFQGNYIERSSIEFGLDAICEEYVLYPPARLEDLERYTRGFRVPTSPIESGEYLEGYFIKDWVPGPTIIVFNDGHEPPYKLIAKK